jgi:hypothetical protein
VRAHQPGGSLNHHLLGFSDVRRATWKVWWPGVGRIAVVVARVSEARPGVSCVSRMWLAGLSELRR